MRKNNKINVLLIIIILILAWSYLNTAETEVGPFSVEGRIEWSKNPGTVLSVPPLGDIKADTHFLPWRLQLNLEQITIENGFEASELEEEIKEAGVSLLQQLGIKLGLWAVLGGAVLACRGGFTVRKSLRGALIGFLLLSLFAGGLIFSYDFSAWDSVEKTGVWKEMPWFWEMVQSGDPGEWFSWVKQGRVMVENFSSFYNSLNAERDELESDLLILHVTDIHNNPLSAVLIESVVDEIDVDLVIDTGDLTDYGRREEVALLESLGELPVPYVFVAGNHDSPQVIEEVSSWENALVLDNDVAEIAGLKILGWTDPSARDFSLKSSPEQIEAARTELLAFLEEYPEEIDMLAIHDGAIAGGSEGKVDSVLFGHNHQLDYEFVSGTHLINAGSTGGEGLRGFQLSDNEPLTMNLLHFDEDRKLSTVEQISFYPQGSNFSLERKVVTGG